VQHRRQQRGNHRQHREPGGQGQAERAGQHVGELGDGDVPQGSAAAVRRLRPQAAEGRRRGHHQAGADQQDRSAPGEPARPEQGEQQGGPGDQRQSGVPQELEHRDRDRDRRVDLARVDLLRARRRRPDGEGHRAADRMAVPGDDPVADQVGAERLVRPADLDAQGGAGHGDGGGDPLAVRRQHLGTVRDRGDALTERDGDLSRGRGDDAARFRVRGHQRGVRGGRRRRSEQGTETDHGDDQHAHDPRPPSRCISCHGR
jgi:hypothetical protein